QPFRIAPPDACHDSEKSLRRQFPDRDRKSQAARHFRGGQGIQANRGTELEKGRSFARATLILVPWDSGAGLRPALNGRPPSAVALLRRTGLAHENTGARRSRHSIFNDLLGRTRTDSYWPGIGGNGGKGLPCRSACA